MATYGGAKLYERLFPAISEKDPADQYPYLSALLVIFGIGMWLYNPADENKK